jgi:hypothetical protein
MGSPDSRSTNLHACIGSQTTRGRFRLSHSETSVLPYELNDTLGTPKLQIFRGSIPSLPAPLSTLRCALTERQRMTRGQCGSLLLSL